MGGRTKGQKTKQEEGQQSGRKTSQRELSLRSEGHEGFKQELIRSHLYFIKITNYH